MSLRAPLLFALVALLILWTGYQQSWNSALLILNMGLVSAIMALGVNLQWGFAGLFNIGVMGFVALGGLGAVLIAMPPTTDAWAAGGFNVDGHAGRPLVELFGVAFIAPPRALQGRAGRKRGSCSPA